MDQLEVINQMARNGLQGNAEATLRDIIFFIKKEEEQFRLRQEYYGHLRISQTSNEG